jgi:hypothetical protein
MDGVEVQLSRIFVDKLPRLSVNTKDIVVKVMPWILIVLSAIGLLTLFLASGLFGYAGIVGWGYITGYNFFLMLIFAFSVAMQVMILVAGYFMLSRQLRGWRLALYSLLLSVAVHLFSFSVFGIALDLLGVYLLFQIKVYYMGKPKQV